MTQVPPALPATPIAPPILQGPGAVASVQVPSLDALVAQEAVLQQQLASLSAQVREIGRQVSRSNGEARVAARSQLSQLNVQLAETRASLDVVRAQIRGRLPARFGPGQTGAPGWQPRQDYIPGEAVAAIAVVFILAVLMPLSIGFTRRLWRRGATAAKPAEDVVSPRLDRLEHAVDAIAIEIERISEGQRFMTKVMSERPTASVLPPRPAEQEESVLGEAKPFLALGAGPVEPIPIAQRQAVRQSVTPH